MTNWKNGQLEKMANLKNDQLKNCQLEKWLTGKMTNWKKWPTCT